MSSEGYLLEFTGPGGVEPTTPISFGDGEYDEGSDDEQGEQTSPATSGEEPLPDKKDGVNNTTHSQGLRGHSQMKSVLRVHKGPGDKKFLH